MRRLWNAATSQPIGERITLKGTAYRAVFSMDGKIALVVSSDLQEGNSTAVVIDAARGETLGQPIESKERISDAQIAPDGGDVVVLVAAGTARLFDTKSARAMGELVSDKVRVESTRFAPDGKTFLTIDQDETTQFWDRESPTHRRSNSSAIAGYRHCIST